MRTRKLKLFFQVLKRKALSKFDNFVSPEPVVKSVAISNTVYLLSRDFSLEEQNEIVIDVIKQLIEKRDLEVIELKKRIEHINTENDNFKQKVVLT